MNVKAPIGECRYCGQEFMTRGGLKNHEKDHCPQRPRVEQEEERARWRRVVTGNGMAGWVREQ